MDLPSTRELELEALVRQRDGQVSELNVSFSPICSTERFPSFVSSRCILTPALFGYSLYQDEITRLRQYIAHQPAPSATDPVTLPPPLMNILLPHIQNASQSSTPTSSTVVNALTQRARLLQEENDELYQILKVKETGKLKEEVRGLRRVVQRLEGSLRGNFHFFDSPNRSHISYEHRIAPSH